MKIAFVANTGGNLPLLETVMAMLVERHEVDHIVAVDGAARDVEAVLRSRRMRFPIEVPWADKRYPDFVLASVLSGVIETPQAEVDRTQMMETALRSPAGEGGSIELAGRHLGVQTAGREPIDPVVVVAGNGRHGVERAPDKVRICPGHLREPLWQGEPASCALVALAEGALYVGFLNAYGDLLEEAEPIESTG
ncbi:MAG: hypothetical protein KC620_03710 [Myxococcales bacterium]|nr:hypothetical protein [Myxococcales bacterium]